MLITMVQNATSFIEATHEAVSRSLLGACGATHLTFSLVQTKEQSSHRHEEGSSLITAKNKGFYRSGLCALPYKTHVLNLTTPDFARCLTIGCPTAIPHAPKRCGCRTIAAILVWVGGPIGLGGSMNFLRFMLSPSKPKRLISWYCSGTSIRALTANAASRL